MISTDKALERYKKLILSEKFPSADPNSITDEALKAIIEKGYLACASNGKTLCFLCGSYIRNNPETEPECPICFNKFK